MPTAKAVKLEHHYVGIFIQNHFNKNPSSCTVQLGQFEYISKNRFRSFIKPLQESISLTKINCMNEFLV